MNAKVWISLWVLLMAVLGALPASAPAQSFQDIQSSTTTTHSGGHRGSSLPSISEETPPMSAKQKQSIMHANFTRSKIDAAELAALAKELREQLNKPGVDVASLEIVGRAEKIEKLAKRIREETKGF